MSDHETHKAIRRALLRDKIHLEPGSRARLPTSLGESPLGRDAWAPARKLADLLRPFPAEMLRWWSNQPTGHAVIGRNTSRYQPGPVQIRRRTLTNVAFISPLDLIDDRSAVLATLASLFDHLLGCGGNPAGRWLSEGGGITAEWRKVGERIAEFFQLEYAPEEATRSPRAYFAWGLALYCTDRRQLNVIDPLLERLLHTTIMSGRFWRKAMRDIEC